MKSAESSSSEPQDNRTKECKTCPYKKAPQRNTLTLLKCIFEKLFYLRKNKSSSKAHQIKENQAPKNPVSSYPTRIQICGNEFEDFRTTELYIQSLHC